MDSAERRAPCAGQIRSVTFTWGGGRGGHLSGCDVQGRRSLTRVRIVGQAPAWGPRRRNAAPAPQLPARAPPIRGQPGREKTRASERRGWPGTEHVSTERGARGGGAQDGGRAGQGERTPAAPVSTETEGRGRYPERTPPRRGAPPHPLADSEAEPAPKELNPNTQASESRVTPHRHTPGPPAPCWTSHHGDPPPRPAQASEGGRKRTQRGRLSHPRHTACQWVS